MEDISAKRDSRRRRILENSEKRLSKITGRNISAETQGTSSQTSFTSRDIKEDILGPSINGIISDEFNHRIKDANGFKSNDTWNGIATTPKYKHNDATTETKDIHSTLSGTRTSPFVLLTNRWNYIVLAVVVNVLLVLQLDHLFGKTIAIPYFPIMLGRLYTCIDTQETHNGSLLYAVLILCNIKPELTYRLKKIVSIFHVILADLALYIFSFALIHYGLFHCLRNADTPSTLDA